MGAKQVRPDIPYIQYEDKFKRESQNCQNSPAEDRQCKDICCLVTFIILTLIFIGAGVYFMTALKGANIDKFKTAIDSYNTTKANSTSSASSTNSSAHLSIFHKSQIHFKQTQNHYDFYSHDQGVAATDVHFPSVSNAVPWIMLMAILSLILSIAIIIAVSIIPKIIIYGMIILTSIFLLGGIVAGVLLGVFQLTITFAIFGFIWGLLLIVMLCCYRDQFNAAIVLLKVSGTFFKSKPSVILAPLIVMFLSTIYIVFWLATFAGIQLDRPEENIKEWAASSSQNSTTTSSSTTTGNQQTPKLIAHDILTLFWLFLNLFYTYFLYYVMVFLIATATALWYYNKDENFIIKGFRNLFKAHIGSLTFASLLVAIVTTLKNMVEDNNNQNQNVCSTICRCIVLCCLSFLQQLIKVLNHNSVIVMSVTGQGFMDSAKSAILLIYNNFGLFMAVDMVQFLLNICVLFFVVLVPTGFGILLLKLTYNQSASGQQSYIILGGLAIFFICLLISLIVVKIFSEVLSSVFIFYCLDQKFVQYNYGSVNNVPGDLRGMFNEIEQQGRNSEVHNFYRDSKQIDNRNSAGYPRI